MKICFLSCYIISTLYSQLPTLKYFLSRPFQKGPLTPTVWNQTLRTDATDCASQDVIKAAPILRFTSRNKGNGLLPSVPGRPSCEREFRRTLGSPCRIHFVMLSPAGGFCAWGGVCWGVGRDLATSRRGLSHVHQSVLSQTLEKKSTGAAPLYPGSKSSCEGSFHFIQPSV